MPRKSELRAVEYRTRARQAFAMADACVLDRAREQHEQSAARWTNLADGEDRRALQRETAALAEARVTTLETQETS